MACPGCSGSARAAPATCSRARSPIPRWERASSRSCSRSRAEPSPRPCSPRSPGSRSSRCGCAACRCCWRPPLCAGLVGAWALSRDPFTKILQPLAAKESVAGEFGLLILLMSVVLLLVGLLVNAGLARAPVPMRRAARRPAWWPWRWRWRVPLVGLTSVAVQPGRPGRDDRRPGGRAGERDRRLHRPGRQPPDRHVVDPREVLARGRPGVRRPAAAGRGSGRASRSPGCATAPTPPSRATPTGSGSRRSPTWGSWAGRCVVALLIAWLAAAARATLLYPRRLRRDGSAPPPRRDWTGERTALVALTLVAVTFGLQSAIDWTWFVPGPAAMALVAAGYVAGRGPLAAGEPAAAPAAPARDGPRAFAAAAVVVAAVLVAWAIWQPEASDRAVDQAVRAGVGGALRGGAGRERRRRRRRSALAHAALHPRGRADRRRRRRPRAERTLEQAVLSFPGDPRTWLRLTRLKLSLEPAAGGRPDRARRALPRSLLDRGAHALHQRPLGHPPGGGPARAALSGRLRPRPRRRARPGAPGRRQATVRGCQPSSRRARAEVGAGAPRVASVRRPALERRRAAQPLAEQLEGVRESGRRAAGHVVHAAVPAPLEGRAPWPRRRRRRR